MPRPAGGKGPRVDAGVRAAGQLVAGCGTPLGWLIDMGGTATSRVAVIGLRYILRDNVRGNGMVVTRRLLELLVLLFLLFLLFLFLI